MLSDAWTKQNNRLKWFVDLQRRNILSRLMIDDPAAVTLELKKRAKQTKSSNRGFMKAI